MLPGDPSTPAKTDRKVEADDAGEAASTAAPAARGNSDEDPTVEVAAMEAIAAAADSAAELDVPIDLEPEAAKRKDDPDRKRPA